MRSLLPEKHHYYIYIFALIVLVIGLPLSKFLMSLSQIILACNWLLEGGLKNKIKKFWNNKAAVVLSSFLLLHFIGLLYSSDLSYAFKDIRIKAPLFILPLIISSSKPLSKKWFDIVLYFFIGAVIFGTIVSTLILTDVIHRQVLDVRTISIFISHIRFSLLICVAIFICGYFIYDGLKAYGKLLWASILIWLIVFLILLESITGLSILIFSSFILIVYKIIGSENKLVKWSGLTALLILLISVYHLISMVTASPKKELVDFSKLDTHTAQGNMYEHDLNNKQTENGHYIWIYSCPKELELVWNQRSKLSYNNKDLKGNEIRHTLMRYLASKGLRKDANALNSLTNDEIRAIERGVANVNYQNVSSLTSRLHKINWELELYKTTGDPNGHSLTQRFEYWKAALGIIKANILFGVGTGDVQQAFDDQYIRSNSPLFKEWRLRAHNQYLSIAVAFGTIGLLWFLISLFYPVLKQRMVFDYLYITFFIIAAASFLTEDTLETQAGVTFYAFLNAFFMFGRENTRTGDQTVS